MASKNVRFSDEPVMDEEDVAYLRRKRRRIEDVDDIDTDVGVQEQNTERKQQHTLDSDEEEEEKVGRLDVKKTLNNITEEATIEYDGNVKIMAFNMNEDLEEGHFDNEGNFIFDKKQEEIKDAWLDNIDWNRVKHNAGAHWHKDESDTEGDAPPQKLDEKVVYEKLTSILHENETVAKALKRMNSEKGLSAAEERKRRWAAKKAGTPFEDTNAKSVAELTSLADQLISAGHMEAYQLNKEDITKLLDEINNKEKVALDMFADDDQIPTASTTQEKVTLSDVTMWEYRLPESDEIHGPFPTTDMMKKVEEKTLKDGTMVRRTGTDAFYDIKRIDFELFD